MLAYDHDQNDAGDTQKTRNREEIPWKLWQFYHLQQENKFIYHMASLTNNTVPRISASSMWCVESIMVLPSL